MENCVIYSHPLEFNRVIEIVREYLPNAKIESKTSGQHKGLQATIKGGLFGKTKKLTINYRERVNPSYTLNKIECEMTQNLAGMVNYIQSFPAHNEQLKEKFLFKAMASNCDMPFMVEPSMTPEFGVVLRKICQELNAFIFAQPSAFFNKSKAQHFVDKNLDLILDQLGFSEIEDLDITLLTEFYDEPEENYTDEQKDRKNRSESFLENHQIRVHKKLPAIPSSENVQLRSVDAIIDRVYALTILAARGEGVPKENLERVIADKKINGFSPREREVIYSDELTDEQKAYSTWRYEALYPLLWVIGISSELKYPSEICDVQAIVGSVIQPSREDFEASVQLRSKGEILDELDKTYRMNWACVNARIKGEEVGGRLIPGIVHERHYAFNWLTNYHNQSWDEVSVDT